ncbi:SseB family protein [Ornithinimicrobium avium]|uniref:SseB family protein n=1 Tax=Ornithinimicrobium avium TaxID=2283195 RepID=A0A345NJ36_9MICO|nr:SseB family protein [Ornithinimicrobium avium]AXH95044.1 SseB family protein [Ornithinimicrobium avium]
MTHRFSGHDPADGHDTAGVPWRRRTLTGTGFDGDTGQADATLARLLGEIADGDSPDPDPAELVAAVSRARLVVGIVAVPGEIDDSSGIPADASSDMASVTLVAPDGQRALPAFTSTAALAEWNDRARPVPVTAQRAALAAVQEGCEVIPLDLSAPPGPPAYTLRPSMVWALATARPWVAAHEDAHVAAAVAAAVAPEPAVDAHELEPGATDPQALQVCLALRPGLNQDQVQSLVTRVGERIAADGEARARIDALAFRLRPAG